MRILPGSGSFPDAYRYQKPVRRAQDLAPDNPVYRALKYGTFPVQIICAKSRGGL